MMPIKVGDSELYTVEELSQMFNMTPVAIRRNLRKGILKGKKLGNRWYVSSNNLKAYFEGRDQAED